MKSIFTNKRLSLYIAFFTIILLLILNITAASKAAVISLPIYKTSIRIKVIDTNNKAIKNAKVTILDDNIFFYSDNNGLTPIIEVTFNINRLDNNANWSTISIFITKDGYASTLLYDCIIYKDRMRDGPTITMLTTNQTQSSVVTIVESPPDEWVNNLPNK